MQLPSGERDTLVGPEPLVEVVVHLARLAHVQGHGDGVFLDHLVGLLPAHTGTHTGHEDLRRREERQVTMQFGVDDGRERPELGQDGEERLEHAVNGVEGVRQGDTPHHRAGDISLVPLGTGQPLGHGEVTAQHDEETIDTLTRPGVHLVRHGGRADLAGFESLGDKLVACHEPDRRGEVGGGTGDLHQGGDDLEVEGAGIDLPSGDEHVVEAELVCDPAFQLVKLVGVAVEQVEHVLTGPHRPLDAAGRVAVNEIVDVPPGKEHLVDGGGESLAQGRHLGGDVVGTPCHGTLGVAAGEIGHPDQAGHHAFAHQAQ